MSALQIETTTRCTLRCPACSRTIFANQMNRPVPHYDVDPVLVHKFLDCPQGREVKTLSLCGDYGDSIYYPRLFEFVELFKPDKQIVLTTNGSYQTENFWNELAARLNSQDEIRFSIDGLEDTNHLYRVNSDWASIMRGLDIMVRAGMQVVWDLNIFSFNYNRLAEIKQFAESRGAQFVAKKTARFLRPDLEPPVQYIATEELYRPEYSDAGQSIEIEPDCRNLTRNTICSENYFWPCGFIRAPLTFYKSQLWRQKQNWSIKNTTLTQLRETMLQQWVKEIENNPTGADVVCKMKCKRNQSQLVLHKV
jgi:MoaA/NifB/PqqE/SkfB family radical SAM enzyme